MGLRFDRRERYGGPLMFAGGLAGPVLDTAYVVDKNGISPPGLSKEDSAKIVTIELAVHEGRVHDLDEKEHIQWMEKNGFELRMGMDGKAPRNADMKTIREAMSYAQREAKKILRREHTLADALITSKPLDVVSGKKQQDLRRAVTEAQKFVLTPDASERVGQAIASYPEYLVTNSQFAIPPHPVCWIEFDSVALGNAAVPNSMTPQADDRTGYLFYHGEVYIASMKDGDAIFSPMVYKLNQEPSPQQVKDITNLLGITRKELGAFTWGHAISKRLSARFLNGLARKHTISHMLLPTGLETVRGKANYFNSEIRNIVALLLLINQPSKTIYTTAIGRERKLTAKGIRMFMAHNVVTIALDALPKKLLRASKKAQDAWKNRWHSVRGHFVRDRVAIEAKCDHGGDDNPAWEQFEHHKWQCTKCGGRRTWREFKNGRGDASLGISLHHHVVES